MNQISHNAFDSIRLNFKAMIENGILLAYVILHTHKEEFHLQRGIMSYLAACIIVNQISYSKVDSTRLQVRIEHGTCLFQVVEYSVNSPTKRNFI